jgi:glucose/arabinose dehydrogenase
LNHGLALSADGKTIYASSVESVFAWAYDPVSGTVSGNQKEVIKGMSNNDLTTRTLLFSQKKPGTLMVSRGSGEDFDANALDVSTGISQVRAFDLSNFTANSPPYVYSQAGKVLGWGLRNAVGIVEHPVTGAIYALDQGIDGITRAGVDIHENNPAEELNFLGYLNGSTDHQGGNYGYPSCFSVWDTQVPDNSGLDVGEQFPMVQNATLNDVVCERNFVAPRLVFPAHMSPLDMEFTLGGAAAYVTFHGSGMYNHSSLRLSPLTKQF